MGRRITKARVPTRVFIKTIDGSDRLWAFVQTGRRLEGWLGFDYRHFERAPKTKKTYATVADAAAALHERGANLRREGWTEVRYLPKDEETEPHIVFLPYMLRADLRATALVEAGIAPAKAKAAPKPSPPERRDDVLTRIVAAHGTIVVDGKAAPLQKQKQKGQLVLPTGSLVAIDPVHFQNEDVVPFARALRPGRYDVELSVAAGCVGAASVVVRRQLPTRWELALPRGMASLVPPSRRRVTSKPAYGYPVDVAMGSFMDAKALALLQEEDEHALDLGTRAKALRIHDLGAGGTAAVFETGHGDGYYGTYYGFAGDELVRVTSDFLVGA